MKSNGSTAKYYELPDDATELQDLISYRNLNSQDGEIFRAIYRKGMVDHSSLTRESFKVLFYALEEVIRVIRYDLPLAEEQAEMSEVLYDFLASACDRVSCVVDDAEDYLEEYCRTDIPTEDDRPLSVEQSPGSIASGKKKTVFKWMMDHIALGPDTIKGTYHPSDEKGSAYDCRQNIVSREPRALGMVRELNEMGYHVVLVDDEQ